MLSPADFMPHFAAAAERPVEPKKPTDAAGWARFKASIYAGFKGK